jgi:formate dehydrogenase iron-sulfur subunit
MRWLRQSRRKLRVVALWSKWFATASRGMIWLEPLVEVVSPAGRLGFGPMTVADVPGLFGDLAAHPKAIGLVEDHPWMKGQTRLTFARVGVMDPLSLDDYRAHGGLAGWTVPRA